MRRGTGRQIGIWLAGMLAAGTLCPAEACGSEAAVPAKPAIAAVAPLAAADAKTAKKAIAPAAAEPAAPPKETPKPALDLPPIARLLSEGEMLVVAPGQNLTVESPAQSERRLPVIDQITGGVRWVVLPAREKQVVSIRWLDTSNIKKLVEIEMLEGDLFLAANPREQPDLSLAVRGRKSGLVFEGPPSSPAAPVVGATGVTPSAGAAATGASAGAPAGANAASTWTAVDHRTLKLHLEVDASLRVVGYGHSLLPAGDDPTLALGIHLFASLRPGATLQNSGETTLVIEQYSTRAAGRWSDAPTRVVLPPETSLSTNGGRYDLRHFYIPEPGQPAGPARVEHIGANPPADARMNAGLDTSGARAADATAGVLP